MTTEIITNNQPRNLLYGYELTAAERAEFDWISDDDIDATDFVRYKGEVYCVSEFMLTPDWLADKGWQGYSQDSMFSAILFSYAGSEQAVMGLAIS